MRIHLKHYLTLLLGSSVYALGFSFLLFPNALVTGGVTGISMIINFLSGFPVGLLIISCNIPIFLLGFKKLGLKFLLDSFLSMSFISLLMDLLDPFAFPLTDNLLLAAIFGGLICGFGIGLAFSTGATTGGTDIIARLLRSKYQFINIGQIILIIDALILAAYSLILALQAGSLSHGIIDKPLYSVIAIFISTHIIDAVLYGVNYGKLVYIISDAYDSIGKQITGHMNRGVTLLFGKGAYSGKDKVVLLVAIKRRQIVDLKKIVRSVDPSAFLIISETREVVGEGFEHIDI